MVSATLAILFTVLLGLSIYHQRIHIDEAWLGEQSYRQSEEGVRRSELFRGLLEYDEHVLVAHKLFIWLGALTIGIFGWHLWALRLVPLVSGAALIILLWYYFHRRSREHSGPSFSIAMLYLLAAPLFFRFVNLYRPEVTLSACGLSSFLLLAEYINSRKLAALLASAAVSGIGFLLHLNGVIFIGAAVLALLWVRQWKAAIAFALVSAAMSSLYFYDVIGHWDKFWYQFTSDPALDKQDLTWYAPVWRLLNEHKRLFRKPEVIFASILHFCALWYYWKNVPRTERWIAIYAIGLVICLGAFAQGKTVAYTILLLPVSAIIVAVASVTWLNRLRESPRALSLAATPVWLMFLCHSLYDNATFALTQKRDVAATNRVAASFIPGGATVLAPLDFIFEEIDKYQIQGDEAAGWIMKLERPDIGDIHKSLHAPDYLKFAEARNIDAIIMENHLFTRVGQQLPAVSDSVFGYVVVGKVDEPPRTILLRIDHVGGDYLTPYDGVK